MQQWANTTPSVTITVQDTTLTVDSVVPRGLPCASSIPVTLPAGGLPQNISIAIGISVGFALLIAILLLAIVVVAVWYHRTRKSGWA